MELRTVLRLTQSLTILWGILMYTNEQMSFLPQIMFFYFSFGQIWVSTSTYTTAHGNAGSLTHRARPEIEPASSWILVGFITTEPQWELPYHVVLMSKIHLFPSFAPSFCTEAWIEWQKGQCQKEILLRPGQVELGNRVGPTKKKKNALHPTGETQYVNWECELKIKAKKGKKKKL